MQTNRTYKGDKGDDLSRRLLDFAVHIIRLVQALPNTPVGKHIGGQVLRSGTSPGSNYEEARGAESRADFVHKLGIVLKELKETRFWLRVASLALVLDSPRVEPILNECEELCAIMAKSILTAKNRK